MTDVRKMSVDDLCTIGKYGAETAVRYNAVDAPARRARERDRAVELLKKLVHPDDPDNMKEIGWSMDEAVRFLASLDKDARQEVNK